MQPESVLAQAGRFYLSLAEFCHIKLHLEESLIFSYANWLRKLGLFRPEKGRLLEELIEPKRG